MPIGNPISPFPSDSAMTEVEFVATGGQTVYTISGGYLMHNVAVYRNGVRLVDTLDYNATDQSTIVLTAGATVGDNIVVQIYGHDNTASPALSTTYGGTVNGNLRVGVSTSIGCVLTSANGTKYRLFVENDGSIKTVTA